MNASPSHNELRDTWNERLTALGDDEKAIESSMQAAQAVVRQHAERLNAFNRVVCLPAEILEPIFLAVQSAEPFSGPMHHSWKASSEWVLLTHVCRRWRQIAIGYSDLWTDVDIDWYGTAFCTEMLSRLGTREFSITATVKKHQEFLFDVSLRKRIPLQLCGLTLNFDDTVTQPGAFLDTLLSNVSAGSTPVLRDLQMTCRNPEDMYWATLNRVLPVLESLHLSYLYPSGHVPKLLPKLTDLTFTSVELTSHGPEAPGILDLLPAMPVLESLTFINCSFSPLEAPKAVLPSSIELVHFEAVNGWSLQQCRSLSRTLIQTTGDRVFMMGPATPDVAEEIFDEVKEAVDTGRTVHEVTLELTGWATLDATIDFVHETFDDARPFRIEFRQMSPSGWSAFCTSIESIRMLDASLHIICDEGTPYMFASNQNMIRELRRLTVSAIYLTGRISSYPAISLFNAMREEDEADSSEGAKPSLAFPALRDIIIEHPPHSTAEITNLGLVPEESLSSQLDEAALYLLWYARARREHDLKPLRTVALPTDLLQRHWATELNELLEEQVVSYGGFTKAGDETESMDCRAVVLYRPVLRALQLWNTCILTAAPVIGTLGILWTSSRPQ